MSPALTINPMTTAYLFDLDGTLTSVELLPLIAREIGLEESMGELTRATMAGEIAFPESFSRRVAMLSHVPTKAVAEIVRSAPVHRQLLDWVLVHKEQCWVVTSNLDVWIEPWLQKYGLKGFSSTSRMTNGVISIDEILYKQDVLAHFDGFRTVIVGDGANDAEIIHEVDIGVANELVHPAPEVVLEVADYLARTEESLCRLLARL